MSVHLFECPIRGTPPEPQLLEAVTVRLMENGERERFDEELLTKHYLKNATAVGRVLRYVAEYQGQWVALLVFSSAGVSSEDPGSVVALVATPGQRAAASHRAECPVSGSGRSRAMAEPGLAGFEVGL